MKLKENDILNDVIAIDHTYEGLGTVKIDNYPIFVENLLPGEVANITIKKANSRFAFAKVIKRKTTSKKRVEIENTALMKSGSTSLANLSYNDQLEFKENFVNYLFSRNIHFNDINKIFPSNKIWNYRNKLTVFVKLIDNEIKLGLYEKNTHNLIEQTSYDLAAKPISLLLEWIKNNINYYKNMKENVSNIENITVRYSDAFDQLMLVFNVKKQINFEIDFLDKISKAFPQLKVLLEVKNNNVLKKYLSKQTFIYDKIGDLTFKINFNSFFQVNSSQTNNLYELLINNMNLEKSDNVLDAYCGIGTIGLKVSKKVKQVIGIEIIKEAIENAIENAKINGISNISFYSGDVYKIIESLNKQFNKIIVDPPRSGLEQVFLEKILEMKPKQIGYISCNPHTLCRDVDLFLKSNMYELTYLQPCDMFSQTHHIEAVAILNRKK
ncbi:tRNA (uracil-5-)-methyltransferase related enzyme [Mycoplasmopsis maculosa]|uniref:tRNA (Uracil-5-)-methyltransferase related enzyme n=1 Tax=Mycoplasmopsis maculosa TaxID=114885 RepID=A0A449B4F4_9BACT|nr:23S rRNA (uracil(1939)-C(5))-methyltransferase RlmD [Mycoplasmopsis maculosa]VEU75472.1 tRNA (uracil-5-)-methyltransferase related enzyme [Mycoplasmopsis maculosa]